MEILNIALFDLKKLTRDKMPLLITFLMPVIFIVLMGSVNWGGDGGVSAIPVGVANHDTGKAASRLIDEAGKDKSLSIRIKTEDQLRDGVKNSDIEVGFIIPSDFSSMIASGKIPGITVLKLPSSADYAVIESIFSNAYAKLGLKDGIRIFLDGKMKGADTASKEKVISETEKLSDMYLSKTALASVKSGTYSSGTEPPSGNVSSTTYNFVLGFIILFVMWGVVFSAGEVLQEKNLNTWNRLNITPVGKYKIVLGKMLGSFVRGWIQVIFLLLFSNYIMGIVLGGSIVTLIVIISVFLLCIIFFGSFLSSMVKTNAQLGAISSIVITCTCMLAGCYWPLEIVPDYMQKFARIFPQYWAMKGIESSTAGGGTWDVAFPVLILAGMALLFFLLSTFRGAYGMAMPKLKSGTASGHMPS